MRRYERASTLLTSNRPVDDRASCWATPPRSPRSWIVLIHHAHVLKCGPRSWRTKLHTDLRTEEATK